MPITMDWVSHTSEMRSGRKATMWSVSETSSVPGRAQGPQWTSGGHGSGALLPAWWRRRLRATFSEHTQRSTGRVQAGEDSSSAVSTPKPSPRGRGSPDFLRLGIWGSSPPGGSDFLGEPGGLPSVPTEQEGDPPRLPTCLCFLQSAWCVSSGILGGKLGKPHRRLATHAILNHNHPSLLSSRFPRLFPGGRPCRKRACLCLSLPGMKCCGSLQ